METQALEKTFDTHDEFNRKPIAENIIKLLTLPIDLSPMVIDGGWGTGKTEFCQKADSAHGAATTQLSACLYRCLPL